MTLEHTPECSTPSTFYEIRNGWAWICCRHCSATVVRPPEKANNK